VDKKWTRLRFVTLDPENELVNEVVVAASRNHKLENIHSDLLRGYNFLIDILNSTPKINKECDIRFLNTFPTFGMYLFDENTDQAEAWVWIYCYHAPIGPCFHLLPEQNKSLLDFYQSQFEIMFTNSKSGYSKQNKKEL
jgi:hypothetical protein